METNLTYKLESMNMETSRKVTSYEQNLHNLQRENEELRRKLNDFSNDHNRKVAEYENKIALMKEEI